MNRKEATDLCVKMSDAEYEISKSRAAVGKFVTEYRRSSGLTLKQFAAAIGGQISDLSEMERGIRRWPTRYLQDALLFINTRERKSQ